MCIVGPGRGNGVFHFLQGRDASLSSSFSVVCFDSVFVADVLLFSLQDYTRPVVIVPVGSISRGLHHLFSMWQHVKATAFDVSVNVQMQMQQVMRDNAALKRRIEAMEADVHRRVDTDRDKFSVRVSMLHFSLTVSIFMLSLIILFLAFACMQASLYTESLWTW